MNLFTTLSERIFDWAWTTSVHATPLIVLVFLAQTLLGRRLTPALRYALGCLALIGLLLPAMPASPLSVGNLFPASATIEKHLLGSIPLSADALPGLVRGTAGFPAKDPVATPRRLSTREAASLVWLSGGLCLLSTAVWRHRRWQVSLKGARSITEPGLLGLLERTKISMRVQRPVALAAMDHLGSPAVSGFRGPCLVLPESVLRQLSPSELRLVFMHELAHVRRHDLLQNLLLMGVQFVHWFNPLVWVALRRLRADRELVCDAMVLQKLEPVERLGYGRVLIKLLESLSVEHRPVSSAIPVVSSPSEIKRRMIMIANYRKSGRAGRLATAALVTALGCVTLTRAREGQPAASKAPESPVQPEAARPPWEPVGYPANGFWAAQPLDAPAKVDAVKIERVGPATVSDELIRAHIGLSKGGNYLPQAENDIRALHATGLFMNVRVAADRGPEGFVFTYFVQERPRIRQLHFWGNSKFSDAELRQRISSKVGDFLDERKVFEDSSTIREVYGTAGLKGTVVTYKHSVDEARGDCMLGFEIQEHPHVAPVQEAKSTPRASRAEPSPRRRHLAIEMPVSTTDGAIGEYDRGLLAAIQQRWFALLDTRQDTPAKGKVVVEFQLYSNGSVAETRIAKSTVDKALDLLCQKAVLDPAPFSPWPYAVRKALTNECRRITLTFYFR